MPVSATDSAIARSFGSRSARMVTRPSCVNFSALLSKFKRICFTFCRSLEIDLRSRGRSVVTVSFDRKMIGSSSERTSATSSGILKLEICSGIRPASMREMSRISLMIVSRCRPFDSIRLNWRFTDASRSPPTPCSSIDV